MNGRLIALVSPVMGCGKSSVARALQVAHGASIVPLAGTMKLMVRPLLQGLGLPNEEIDQRLAIDKERPIEQLDGVTVRHLLQTLGTEWGRECIHPDLWVRVWSGRARRLLEKGCHCVVDDCRRFNELEAVRALGGEVWLVTRPAAEKRWRLSEAVAHASEGELTAVASAVDFDRVIFNNGSLAQLEVAALEAWRGD